MSKPGNRFINGHHNHKFQVGDKNIRWRGDEAGQSAIHKWLNKVRPFTGICEECGATGIRTEMSNVDHQWRRVVEDYRELCCRCHYEYDCLIAKLRPGPPNRVAA